MKANRPALKRPMKTRTPSKRAWHLRKNNLNVLSVNTATLLLSIAFLVIGSVIHAGGVLTRTVVTELFIMLVPALALAATGKFGRVLKLAPLSFKNVMRVVVMTVLAYPVILLANGLFLTFISQFMELKDVSMNMFMLDEPVGGYLAFMCILPAVCEELYFRGALINSYDIYGARFAIVMSALIFALFHFDIQNFMAPFLLGILFGSFLELTGSIIASMTAHFVNNVIALFFARYVNASLFDYLGNTNLAVEIGSLQLYIITLLVVASLVSAFIIRLLYKQMQFEKRLRESIYGTQRTRSIQSIDLFNFVPVIAMVILYFIYYKVVF
ncbi:CPBP family glutamic-type intramembrane protease [Peptoniphilus equinus]|uniref:CPBP family glutamic-type intramembrane protease n=1 Tax=Peptoniphilus equinus TaxID=3016343 RepID=A0ABY7QUN4_9FIRM|nr:CPBP family glutamic-type intramembrane protease [Peptoniphilus equinus]WBW49603.1 CPBP family glutamic-type intramembrane protease [Peptoniphilus equinus]